MEASFELNLPEAEFSRVLEEIDTQLSSAGSGIPGREIRGWMSFCQRYQLGGIPMFHPLSQRVMDWFVTRYGARINLPGDFGYSVILLRNDLLRFRCPIFWGRQIVVCSPEVLHLNFPEIGVRQSVTSNLLKQVEGLTPNYAHSLTGDERVEFLTTFVRALISLARISDAGDQRFVPEARMDICTSVEQLMLAEQPFGLSKFSSLQAVEKFLKAFITQEGGSFKWDHKLATFASIAEDLGLSPLNRDRLSSIQCPGSVRYESSSVTRSGAVKAHHVCLLLCAEIASQLKRKTEWRTGVMNKVSVKFGEIPEAIPGFLLARTKQDVGFKNEPELSLRD